ncbi:MAG: FAD synthetase family protein [Chloroflexi bacterium]|nr:MAG: FAD synthetase family protein [Chloroflexota bacterium]
MTDSHATTLDRLPEIGDVALCMGVFDGVHRGHLVLVQATARVARERRLRAVALVFDPHPDEVVRPGSVVPRLAPLHENLRRLSEAGIDEPVGVRFDEALRALAATEFLEALAPAIQVRALVMSPESAFGRNRSGTPDAMEALGRIAGFHVERVETLLTDSDEPISSGRIRRALADDSLDEANRLLGHPAYLEGMLNPTDEGSLRLDYHAALPAAATYRARTRGATPVEVELRIRSNGRIDLVGAPPGSDRIALDVLSRA